MATGVDSRRSVWKELGLALLILLAVFGALFSKSFKPEMVLFSNDAPLGLVSAQSGRQASTVEGLFTGYWQDLNWLGIENPSVLPGLSFGLYLLFGDPVTNAKFYCPLALVFLGFSAWFFFRQCGFRNGVCILGGLAAALNSETLSHSTWGLPSRALTQASIFLALGGLVTAQRALFWVKAVLAGMAVGLGVMEGFDVGALYSFYVAAFALFLMWIREGASTGKRVANGVALVATVAIASAGIAAHALNTLVSTQITGVANMKQDSKSKAQRWDEATMWSLPKLETTRILVPGLFGYRMDTEGGGRYWGAVGQAPGNPESRHSGAGEYAGILVILIGTFAIAAAIGKDNSSFTPWERKVVLFWAAAAGISLLFAWGRHAPFYQILYQLPYFHTIRNPIKFMHFFHLAFLILFGFGLELLCRKYVNSAVAAKTGLVEGIKTLLKTGPAPERKWAFGVLIFAGVSLLGFLIFNASQKEIARYLTTAGIAKYFGPAEVENIFKFATRELGWYLGFLFISILVTLAVLSGLFNGVRARFALIVLGTVLVADMARANKPWIVYYDYQQQYQTGPIIDLLKQTGPEHRTTFKLFPFGNNYLAAPGFQDFAQIASTYLQNHFQYYNILALEPIQMPRMPALDESYLMSLMSTSNQYSAVMRLWQLTSTRTLVTQAGYAEAVSQQLGLTGLTTRTAFQFGAGGQTGIAIVDYTNALPRVAFFNNWQVEQDDEVLKVLRDQNFDPRTKVFLASAPPGGSPSGTNTPGGNARFGKYGPKEFEVFSEAPTAGIVLVNDKFSPNWKVWIDGQPAEVLRCNYIMRGVYVGAGSHKIEFKYRPPVNSLYVTLATMAAGLLLCGYVAVKGGRKISPAP